MNNKKTDWARIISVIDKPLGFYALALLIVESCLTAVVIFSDLTPADKAMFTWVIIIFAVFIVICVTISMFFRPENLTFDQYSHLEAQKKAKVIIRSGSSSSSESS